MKEITICGCAALLLSGAVCSQPISVASSPPISVASSQEGGPVTVRVAVPVEIALYGIFVSAVYADIRADGNGVAMVRSIGISDQSRAEEVFEFMKAAFYSGKASSELRAREFCEKEVRTVADLVGELERGESAHNAELQRVASRISKFLTSEEYAKLVAAAEQRRATWVFDRVDYAATFSRGQTDVAAQVARRCRE